MSGKRLTDRLKKLLVDEYLQGYSLAYLSAKYNVARSTIQYHIKKFGAECRRMGRPKDVEYRGENRVAVPSRENH